MLMIRMTRSGAKKRPYYQIVIADSRSPRDGRFLEKVGTYNPMLKSGDAKRVTLIEERIKHWLKNGAQPTDRVSRFLQSAGYIAKVDYPATPKKSSPKAKAQERMKQEAEAAKAAAEAAAAAAAAPAEATPAEEEAASA